MAIITKEDLIKKFNSYVGENSSDEALSLLEDLTDTVSDYETKAKDTTDWQKKYNDNDAAWRKKYRDRFEQSVEKEEPITPPEADIVPDEVKNLSFDDLFKK